MAIPIGIVMFIFPRISEWLFHYDEQTLRFTDNCNEISILCSHYFNHKLKELDHFYYKNQEILTKILPIENNSNDLAVGQNIELQDFSGRNLLSRDKGIKYQVAFKKSRAFLNFNKMVNAIILQIKQDLFANEKHDVLSEDLAPLYSKRLNGQVENYEIRMFQIRTKLHENALLKKTKEEKLGLLKDRFKLASDLKILFDGKDYDRKEMEIRCNYF